MSLPGAEGARYPSARARAGGRSNLTRRARPTGAVRPSPGLATFQALKCVGKGPVRVPTPDAHDHFRHDVVDWRHLAARQAEAAGWAWRWWELLGKPRRLADIGCGPGVVSLAYAEMGVDVLAVDLRAEALALVPKHPRITVLQHDLEDAPLAKRVDAVVMTDVLHHAKNPAAMLDHAAQSGNAFLVAEHRPDVHHGPPQSARLSPEAVAEWARAAGCSVTQAMEVGDRFVLVAQTATRAGFPEKST